jgi:uncharacterized protein (TIGR02246 family)
MGRSKSHAAKALDGLQVSKEVPMSEHFDEIRSMLERFAAAWKENDGSAVGSFFTDDGTLINPFGERAGGRGSVTAMYTKYFGSMLHGTSTKIDLVTVRDVEDDHAFADAEQTVTAADGSVLLAVHLATLLRREADGWRFVDARPYPFVQRP